MDVRIGVGVNAMRGRAREAVLGRKRKPVQAGSTTESFLSSGNTRRRGSRVRVATTRGEVNERWESLGDCIRRGKSTRWVRERVFFA